MPDKANTASARGPSKRVDILDSKTDGEEQDADTQDYYNECRHLLEKAQASTSGSICSPPPSPALKYDAILQTVGQIGPYQVRMFLILCLPLAQLGLVVMSSDFTLAEPDYRCAIPGLDNDTYAVQGPWHQALIDTIIPADDDCEVYVLTNAMSGQDPGAGNDTLTTVDCDAWVYDQSEFDSSIITEFDLVCDNTYIQASSTMGMFAGSLVGSFVFGILADIIGRKRALEASILLNAVTSVVLAFMPDIVSVLVVRSIQGLSFQMFTIATCTAMELVGPTWRTAMGVGAQFAWLAGEVLVLPLAYFTRDWRTMYLVIGLSALFVLLAISVFTPESPRWLLDKGRLEEAHRIIQRIADSNKTTIPPGAISKEATDDGPQVNVLELFRHKRLVIQTLIIFFNWFATNFLYYGLSLNLDNLPGNIYLNYFIGCLVEGAGYVITLLLLDRLGRKSLHTVAMLLGGIACVAVILPVLFLPEDYSWVVTALAMLGKMSASVCYACLYIMTVELFPTVVRNSGLAFCSIFENTSAMASPYVADLGQLVSGDLSQALPSLVFGSFALVAGLLSTQLPETLGRDLPETIEDAINFNKI